MKEFLKLCVGALLIVIATWAIAAGIRHTAQAFHRYNHQQELYGNV